MGGATEDADIVNPHEMESNLVYFDTSLRANRMVVDRLTRYSGIRKFPEDQELLDDVIVENLPGDRDDADLPGYFKGYTGIDVNIH